MPFDLVQALVRAVEELPAEVRRIVRLDLPNGLPPAYGDPAIIASVIGELIKNAIQATPAASSPYAGAGTRTARRHPAVRAVRARSATDRSAAEHRGAGRGRRPYGLLPRA